MDGTVNDANRDDGRPARCATPPGASWAGAGAATGAGAGTGLTGDLATSVAGVFDGDLDAAAGAGRGVFAEAGLTRVRDLAATAFAGFAAPAAGRLAGAAGFAAGLLALGAGLAAALVGALPIFFAADFAAGLEVFLAGGLAELLAAGLDSLAAGLLAALAPPDFGFTAAFAGILAFTELLFTFHSWQDFLRLPDDGRALRIGV